MEKEKKKRGKRGPYKKRKEEIKKISEEMDDICFPFKKRKENFCIEKIESLNEEKEEKDDEKNNSEKKLIDIKAEINKFKLMKFKIRKYYLDHNGKRKIAKKKRKYKPDDIRKKIKVKFHKTLKNTINGNLKKAGSEKFFTFLPQIFIGNVSKGFNYKFLEYTYKELFSTDFTKYKDNDKDYKLNNKIYLKNIETLEYLEKNKEISKISGYYLIKNMKYKDILKAYFLSNQFEYSIIELKKKKENMDYIQEYIKLSNNYLEYFASVNESENKDEANEANLSNEENSDNNGELPSLDIDFFLEKDSNLFDKNFFDN